MRPDFAFFSASIPRWMSRSLARHSPATVESLIAPATACTASKSPFDEAGKPASITSTRILSNSRAMRSFSSLVIEAPGLCSPSRMVVSNMINLSFMVPLQGEIAKASAAPACAATGTAELDLGLCAREAQQQTRQEQAAEGEAESDGAEMHAGNITGFPGYCNGAGPPRRRFFHTQYTYPDSPYATNSRNSTIGGSEITRINPRTISRITANGTDRRKLMPLKLWKGTLLTIVIPA